MTLGIYKKNIYTALIFFGICSTLAIPTQVENAVDFQYVGELESQNPRGILQDQSNVYYFSNSKSNWGDAWFSCKASFNGHLLSVESSSENKFIRDFMIKHNVDSVWTSGAFDTQINSWRWASTGKTFEYVNWGPGESSKTGRNHRVIIFGGLFSNEWKTVEGDTLLAYICEVPSTASTTTTESNEITDSPAVSESNESTDFTSTQEPNGLTDLTGSTEDFASDTGSTSATESTTTIESNESTNSPPITESEPTDESSNTASSIDPSDLSVPSSSTPEMTQDTTPPPSDDRPPSSIIIPSSTEQSITDTEGSPFQGSCINSPSDQSKSQGPQWHDGKIPYTLDPNFPLSSLPTLSKAIEEYHSKTCIRFVPKTHEAVGWINFQSSFKCFYQPQQCCARGQLDVPIGNECNEISTYLKTMGHILCLGSEVQRPDRDNYISNPYKNCYLPEKNSLVDPRTQDLFYDYVSAMHPPKSSCYEAKLPGIVQMGSDGILSVLDANKINAYYDCGGCLSYRYVPIRKITLASKVFSAAPGDYEGQIIGICRTYHDGHIITGKYGSSTSPPNSACWISNNGIEIGVDSNYEVLTNPSAANLIWVEGPTNGNIPENAIAGGRSATEEPIYIGRCNITFDDRAFTIPGKVVWSVFKGMFVSYRGFEYKCAEYELLVCAEDGL